MQAYKNKTPYNRPAYLNIDTPATSGWLANLFDNIFINLAAVCIPRGIRCVHDSHHIKLPVHCVQRRLLRFHSPHGLFSFNSRSFKLDGLLVLAQGMSIPRLTFTAAHRRTNYNSVSLPQNHEVNIFRGPSSPITGASIKRIGKLRC
jgi:hypothetical protein